MHTILMLAANPKDTFRLRLDEEMRVTKEALRRARRRDDFEVKTTGATRLALVSRLNNQHDTSHLRLYCDLPNNVLPLLSAQLTWKEMDSIEFMERNPRAQSVRDRYVALPMTV